MKFQTDPGNILRTVDIVFQVLDKASSRHHGLWPSVCERYNGQMLMDFPLPPIIPGQRNSDRSPRGANLQHDIPLLQAFDGLDQALNRPGYRIQHDRYLTAFAEYVAENPTATGLLPWGEHSYINLQFRTIGNSYLLQYGERPLDAGIETHQQLELLPFEHWELMHKVNPDLLPRFVDGLDWHWMNEERTLFNRHAPITQPIRGYQIKRHSYLTGEPLKTGGSDFPGAAGTFVHGYACALAIVDNPKDEWREQLLRFSDFWWERCLDSGLLPKSSAVSKTAWNGPCPGQTLSFTKAMFAASDALKEFDPELSQTFFDRGKAFTTALLNLEQAEADAGKLVLQINPDGSIFKASQPWAGNRGQACTAKFAIPLLNCAQRIGDERGLALMERVAKVYIHSFTPREVIVRAGDPGSVINLLSELAVLTGKQEWLDAASEQATDAIELYLDCPLPRMATGRSHYESQQGSSVLVHALARMAMILDGKPCLGGLATPVAG